MYPFHAVQACVYLFFFLAVLFVTSSFLFHSVRLSHDVQHEQKLSRNTLAVSALYQYINWCSGKRRHQGQGRPSFLGSYSMQSRAGILRTRLDGIKDVDDQQGNDGIFRTMGKKTSTRYATACVIDVALCHDQPRIAKRRNRSVAAVHASCLGLCLLSNMSPSSCGNAQRG
jgi:hypothetical protein